MTALGVHGMSCEESQRTLSLSNDARAGKLILAADCGGTTTRLSLYMVDPTEVIKPKQQAPGRLLHSEEYPNILFKSLKEILDVFLSQDCPGHPKPTVAVLA